MRTLLRGCDDIACPAKRWAVPVLDGKTHKITVDVKGHGLTARARRSYLAARPK